MRFLAIAILLLLLQFQNTLAQRKTRLPDSGVEFGLAITPVQRNYFNVDMYEVGINDRVVEDFLPELYLKFPVKQYKIRVIYDRFESYLKFTRNNSVPDEIKGNFLYNSLNIGIERNVIFRRKRLYAFSDLRVIQTSFTGEITNPAFPTNSNHLTGYGIGLNTGLSFRVPLPWKFEWFVEGSVITDYIMEPGAERYLLEGWRIHPRVITTGFIYKFEKAYDCNCPTNTIRR